ncbi:MAG TPA: DUF6184 family natural product biosynthesis lipoprotein [Polyangiaceae bacterium]|jgi:hypothetical protein
MEALRTSVALALVSLPWVGCAAGPGSPAAPAMAPSVGVTASQGSDDVPTVERLTTARCDHEQACNGIGGSNGLFASYDSCLAEIGARVSDQLDPYDCPRIDRPQVDRCVMAIENEGCDRRAGRLERVFECRTSVLCPK